MNGLVFRLDPVTLLASSDGMYQPRPNAYSMQSLSLDSSGTLYTVDRATRRLILLFVDAQQWVLSSSMECHPYPIPTIPPPVSSSSSSSSSTGSSAVIPGSPGGLLGGVDPLIVLFAGAVSIAVVLVLLGLMARWCWMMRRRWSSNGVGGVELEGAKSDEDEQPAYQRLSDDADLSLPRTVSSSDARYDAYVRLYEALTGEPRDSIRHWHGSSTEQHMATHPSTLLSTPVNLSSPSSRPSASSFSASSALGDSDQSSSSSDSSSAIPGPPAITRLSSTVVPRYIHEVTELHMLGEGQSGRVYCGVYEGSRVVVKQPKCRSMSAAQWREWQAHLRLPVHPNLVRFIGSLVMEDTNYLVLGWVEQGSLKSLLSAPTATRTARWYTRPYAVMRAAEDIASALQHVHQHGLVHRDVSARNVLVEADGTFVLADLGLAQEADEPNSTPPVAPTTMPLRWCSPEYLSTMRHTDKADVWALGVTLWEMTSGGRLPYGDITAERRLQEQLQSGLVKLRVDVAWGKRYEKTDERGLASRVIRLIDECLAVDVERRPTAEQVVVMVQKDMAEWDAECAEEAERVSRQWVDEHTAAVPHTSTGSVATPASDVSAEG